MRQNDKMTFNGVRKDFVYLLEGQDKPFMAPISRNVISVPGLPGGVPKRSERGVLYIQQPIAIRARDNRDTLAKIDELAEWLYTDEPAPLEFDSDPGRVYYALLDGSTNLERIGRFRRGTLTFVCPDPHRYGPEQLADITTGHPVTVRGSASSVPITTVTLDGPTTFVAVSDGDRINMVGTPLNVDETPYVREERKLWDQMATTTGWGATTTSDDGPIVGTIGSSGGEFKPTNFGTGSSWHGPGLKKSIGQSLQDFKIDAMMNLSGAKNRVGAVHVLLLDAANNIVAKLNILKNSLYEDGVWVRVRIGNRTEGRNVYSGQGGPGWRWMYFEGRVSLERVGDIWTMSAMRYTPERGWHAGVTRQIRDRDAYALAPVTQIQVNFWQHGTKPTPSTMSVSDLKVYQVNDRPEEIPYIGEAGDVFEFNHQEGTITKNGVNIEDKKAFIGDYFELSKGSNMMLAEPAESISRATVRWRDRWI